MSRVSSVLYMVLFLSIDWSIAIQLGGLPKLMKATILYFLYFLLDWPTRRCASDPF